MVNLWLVCIHPKSGCPGCLDSANYIDFPQSYSLRTHKTTWLCFSLFFLSFSLFLLLRFTHFSAKSHRWELYQLIEVGSDHDSAKLLTEWQKLTIYVLLLTFLLIISRSIKPWWWLWRFWLHYRHIWAYLRKYTLKWIWTLDVSEELLWFSCGK